MMIYPRPKLALDLLWLAQSRSWIRHQVPFLGEHHRRAAGPAGWRPDGCVDINPATLRLPKNARTFALKVKGDSMRNAAILEGDIVIMESREAKHGDIVAGLIDGETTLKRFIVQGGVQYLRASNPKYPDLIPEGDVVILGVQIALLRRSEG